MSILDILFKRDKKDKKTGAADGHLDALGALWMCRYDINPWDGKESSVEFKKMYLDMVEKTATGVKVYCHIPKKNGYADKISGYYGAFDTRAWYSGYAFFNTKQEAEAAFDKMMHTWIRQLESLLTSKTKNRKCKETE